MFAQTQDLEFGQGQSRDVPDRELTLNINAIKFIFRGFTSLSTASTFAILGF